MKQSVVVKTEGLRNLMMRAFRLFGLFCVISTSSLSSFADEDPINLADSIKSEKYQEVVDHLKTIKRKLTPKERMFQALAFEKMGHIDLKIKILREAVVQHPEVDLFSRELAASIELKADSYANTQSYTKIKAALHLEASKILTELYAKKPNAVNFTAVIQYYNRQKLYEETVGLLEIYGRRRDKGKVFFTYMCEAQFKAKLFSAALKSCNKLIEVRPNYPEGHVYLSKTISKLGEKELADKKIIKLASRFPASAPVQLEAGKLFIEKGESEKGLMHLDQHLQVESSDEALVLKAETQFKKGDEEEALSTFIAACKQHKEPRRPLLEKMKAANRSLSSVSPLKRRFEVELSRCRYSYRLKKKAPKGILGGTYKKAKY